MEPDDFNAFVMTDRHWFLSESRDCSPAPRLLFPQDSFQYYCFLHIVISLSPARIQQRKGTGRT